MRARALQCDMAERFTEEEKPLVSRMRGGPACIFLAAPEAPAVSVQAWFPVGGVTETAAVAGVSHFLEHMIFKGSRSLGVGELAALAESAGGDVNAYTTSESTCYDLIAMPDSFAACLEALLDALWLPRLDAEEVRQERQVILSELNRAYEQPDQLLQHHLYRAAYGGQHPYGRAILGTRRTVRRMGARALRAYHRKFYAPSSAVLVCAGAFDVREARAILRERQKDWRAIWPNARRAKRMRAPKPAPPRAGPRAFVRRARAGTAHLDLAFEIPPFTHRDAPALEVLAMVLGAGESARLYERLCLRASLMFDVSAEAYFSGGPGLLFLGGYAAPESAQKACGEIIRVAREVAEDAPPTAEELDKVRMNYVAGLEFRRERMAERARVAGYSALITGDADYHRKYMQRVMGVGADDVSDAARRYLDPARLTAGVLLPKGEAAGVGAQSIRKAIWRGFGDLGEGAAGGANRNQGCAEKSAQASAARAASPMRKVRLSPARLRLPRAGNRPVERALPGGGRLVMLPGGGPAVFSLRAVFWGGQRNESARRSGLHALMMAVAPLATSNSPSSAHKRKVEGWGANIDGFAGRDTFGLTAAGLSEVLPEVAREFADTIAAPAFEAEDVEFVRAELNAERDSGLEEPGQYCRFKGHQLLYGRHPLGRHPLGTARTMAAFRPDVLRREWRKRASPAHLVIAAAGNFDPSHLAERLPGMLAPWAEEAPREASFLQPAPPRVPRRRRARSYALEGASQGHIHMSFLGATFRDPARHALAVIAAALGSQAGGLFWELREKRGLAYEVSVSAQEFLDPGPVSIYAATLPGEERLAIDLMRQEVARLRESGLGEEELRRAKAYLIGGLSRSHQRASARASDLAFGFAYGVGWETLEESIGQVERVDVHSAREAARRFLVPAAECLVTLSGDSPG